MINRTAKEALLRLASQFPVVGVTGPRQSGKSTLTKAVFPNKRYVTFDDRTMRELAISNPSDFLAAFPDGAIIDEAQKALEYDNFMMGINGVVTFKKSTLPEVLKQVPLDRLVLETDSPYLAPTPFRGKRNESSYVGKVADKLAEIYGLSATEICSITTRNALKVFEISD